MMDLRLQARRLRSVALLALGCVALACDSASTIVGVNDVAVNLTITVHDMDLASGSTSVGTLEVEVGESVSLAAVGTNALGFAVGEVAVGWSTSDEAVVGVTASGVLTATGAGTATVYASTDEVVATLSVVVTAPDEVPLPTP